MRRGPFLTFCKRVYGDAAVEKSTRKKKLEEESDDEDGDDSVKYLGHLGLDGFLNLIPDELLLNPEKEILVKLNALEAHELLNKVSIGSSPELSPSKAFIH